MKSPDCWICNDMGMVIYEKIYNKIPYEMAFRCSCRRGLSISNRVSIVENGLAEKLAMDNFEKYGVGNEVQSY